MNCNRATYPGWRPIRRNALKVFVSALDESPARAPGSRTLTVPTHRLDKNESVKVHYRANTVCAFLIRGPLATRADLPRRDGSRFSEPRIRKASYFIYSLSNSPIIYHFDRKVNVWFKTKKEAEKPAFFVLPIPKLSG